MPLPTDVDLRCTIRHVALLFNHSTGGTRMPTRVARIGHVGIAVADLDRTVDFYCGLLGLEVTERFDYGESEAGHGTDVVAGAFVRCDSTHHCISFFALRAGGEPAGRGASLGLHHLAFEMRTSEDLVVKYRELRDAGVPIVNARTGGPGNQPRFYAT